MRNKVVSYAIVENTGYVQPLRQGESAEGMGLIANVRVNRNGKIRIHYQYRAGIENSYHLGGVEIKEVDTRYGDNRGDNRTLLYKTEDNGWKEIDKFLSDFIDSYGKEEIFSHAQDKANQKIIGIAETFSNSDYINIDQVDIHFG